MGDFVAIDEGRVSLGLDNARDDEEGIVIING